MKDTKKDKDGPFDVREYLKKGNHEAQQSTVLERYDDIPLDKIRANPFQPRKTFNKENLEGLAQSIKEDGLHEPVIVREVKEPESPYMLELAAGERRVRACRLLGHKTIKAIIKQISDKQMKTIASIENIQREDLNYVETMNAYVNLKEEFGNAEGVAEHVGKEKRTVERYLKIHNEVYSMPDIAALFEKQAADIGYGTLESFAKIAPEIRRLQKANSREFNAIFKRLGKKGIEASVPGLIAKFGRHKATDKGQGNGFFRETEKALFLSIRVRKAEPVSGDVQKSVNESVSTFMSRFSECCSPTEAE
jgi:ParB/RepB/Spo0J family partition protein